MDPHREFKLGDWLVTPLRGVIHRATESRRLTPKAMDVLLCLVRQRGEVVEREALLDEVWDGRAQSDEPLNKCIAEIRRQFGDDRGAPSFIETIPKRGYRLIAKYEAVGGEQPDAAGGGETPPGRKRVLFAAAAMVLVVLLAAIVLQRGEEGTAPRGDMIALAVLPFDVVSSGESRDYFADGMHEELIAALSRNASLVVRSRTSTLQYRNTETPLPDIGRALDADVIVQGTVRQEQDQVRVTVQLIDADSDSHLWSGSFEETLSVSELFSIQNRIASDISAALETTLATADGEQGSNLPTDNLQAYDHFMLGKYHYRRQLPGDMQVSVRNFEAAVALDPLFADAWDWLAYAYNHAATSIGQMSPHEAYPKARAAALRALEIKPDLATAISILGYIRAVYDWDWVGAERDMRRALQLNPGDSGTVWSLAHVLSMLGRHDEAIRMTAEFATERPTVGRLHQEVANRLLDAGRYAEALTRLEQAEQFAAEQAQIDEAFGVALVGLGDMHGALQKFEQAVSSGQRSSRAVARLAFVYTASGRAEDARRLVDELELRAQTETISALTFAAAYLGIGDRERALDFLETAARDRDRDILSVRFDPFFTELRDEPRYLGIIDRFGIP